MSSDGEKKKKNLAPLTHTEEEGKEKGKRDGKQKK